MCKMVLDLLGTVTLLVLCQHLSPVVEGIPQPAHQKRYTHIIQRKGQMKMWTCQHLHLCEGVWLGQGRDTHVSLQVC